MYEINENRKQLRSMAILKSEIRNKFTTIPNSVVRCKDLSDGDYRLLIYLFSLPDDWKINQAYLGQELGCNTRNIRLKIKRIKDAGYLEIKKTKDKDDINYIYILKEKEVSEDDLTLRSVNDRSVNDLYTNTYITNTELIGNKNIYYSDTCDEQQEETSSKKNKFKKPTLEEVTEYCKERKNNIDPQYFIDSNEAKGWVVGKNQTPMKDWKAVVRTWENNNKNKFTSFNDV